jgi:hypothetical protein
MTIGSRFLAVVVGAAITTGETPAVYQFVRLDLNNIRGKYHLRRGAAKNNALLQPFMKYSTKVKIR